MLMRHHSIALSALVACLLVVLAGCSSSPEPQPVTSGPTSATTHIIMKDNAFSPTGPTMKAQTTMHFQNEGSNAHTVTIHKVGTPSDARLTDQQVDAGKGTDFKFNDAGTYHVWCKFHGQMTSGMAMIVTVQ